MSELLKLQPANLWKNFNSLCNIPRPSKFEAKVIEFVVQFAKDHKLSYKTDAVGNVMISKPATKGLENRTTVVLQSHLDISQVVISFSIFWI